jgi:nanoRNase/pAp phosphatase (c-di-AMP/oligoRNAs hydrolase)
MALLPEQQAVELIGRSKNILVTTREHASMDAISSAIAVGLVLKKLNKTFDVSIPGFDAKDLPSFLPNTVEIRPTVGAMRAFHLSIDVEKTPLSELMYDVKDGKLNITIVPKHGEWTETDVKLRPGSDRYDLVIAVDAPDMASLGNLFRDKADFLYRTTVINIDCSATNESWGQVNLVDLNAVATSEVVYGFLSRWNKQHIDADVATSVLAGMISRTRSFRSSNVTPNTLKLSSELVAIGARRGDIVQGLWRNQSIPTLKLWGRILSRLEQDRESGLVHAVISDSDFIESGARREALEGVVDELIAYAPDAKLVVLIEQTRDGLLVHVHAQTPLNAAELVRPFGGTGSRDRAHFSFKEAQDISDAKAKIIEKLATALKGKK